VEQAKKEYAEFLKLDAKFRQIVEQTWPVYAQLFGKSASCCAIRFGDDDPDFVTIVTGYDELDDEITEKFPAAYLYDARAAASLTELLKAHRVFSPK
jgi:hypothetical protein